MNCGDSASWWNLLWLVVIFAGLYWADSLMGQ